MAPPSLAFRSLSIGGSSGSVHLYDRSFASSSRIEPRQGALGWWDEASRFRYDSIRDEGGRFNGTCSDSELTLAPQPERGHCASYYPDVTTFCCGAVGGILATENQETDADALSSATSSTSSTVDGVTSSSTSLSTGTRTSSSATSTGTSSSSNDMALPTDLGSPSALISEPSCTTTNYADMLECYRDTTEAHCKGALNGPYGVCNAYGADTSRSASLPSSAAPSHRPLTRKFEKGWKRRTAIGLAISVALAGNFVL